MIVQIANWHHRIVTLWNQAKYILYLKLGACGVELGILERIPRWLCLMKSLSEGTVVTIWEEDTMGMGLHKLRQSVSLCVVFFLADGNGLSLAIVLRKVSQRVEIQTIHLNNYKKIRYRNLWYLQKKICAHLEGWIEIFMSINLYVLRSISRKWCVTANQKNTCL